MTERNSNTYLRSHMPCVDEATFLSGSSTQDPFRRHLNVSGDFGADEMRNLLMKLFEQVAGQKLTHSQRELAIKTGLAFEGRESPDIGAIVEIWRAEPDLHAFATALGDAAILGPHAGSLSRG